MRGLDITSRQEEEGGGVNLFKFKIKIIQLVILIDRRAVRKKKQKMRGQVTRVSAQDLHLTSRFSARPMKKKERERGALMSRTAPC